LLATASVTLDDNKRAALIAQSYDLALGQDVAAIPMLFQITAWGMRKGITYSGFPQDATVAALVHGGK
jgi:ABC-type transport system substrate-binding protein